MKTSLAYIDDVMEREITKRQDKAVQFSDKDKAWAKEKANRTISGFTVFDEDEEKKYLDGLIAARRTLIDKFIDNRAVLKQTLADKGITPLACLPTDAWNAICDQTELFRLNPESNGGLSVPYHGVSDWVVESTETKRNMFGGKFTAKSYNVMNGGEAEINQFARENWHGFLKKLFGGLVAIPGSNVTLVLPTPPKDVAETLLRANKGVPLTLKIAAEADAIAFKQAPSEILKNMVNKMEAEARMKELRDADPIVYTEYGTATAVIAQFGDFPIEQMVVDAVVEMEDLIKTNPAPTDPVYFSHGVTGGSSAGMLTNIYAPSMGQLRLQAEQARLIAMYGQQYQGGLGVIADPGHNHYFNTATSTTAMTGATGGMGGLFFGR